MKLNNEKKEVFKDPFPIHSLADVGRVITYGTIGAVGGAVVGAFGGLGAAIATGAAGGETIMPLITGGMVVGAVTGAAIGVVVALKENGFYSLVDKARKIAAAPGFDSSVLDTPVNGLKVGEKFIVTEEPTTNTAGAFLGAGPVGLAVACARQRQKEDEYEKLAANPNHRLGKHVGYWDGEESLIAKNDGHCRNTRLATLRDVLEFKDPVAGKDLLREFVQTGRVDSFITPAPAVVVNPEAAQQSGDRLASFMKSTLKGDAPEPARSTPKPA